MTKPSRVNPAKEMTTVYGKIPKDLADRLDGLAEQRRWSRAQMVAFCIEHFIENDPAAPGPVKGNKADKAAP